MRAWVDRAAALAGEDHLWTGGFQFGDWLDPAAPHDAAADAKADPDVVATAHLARSAEVVSLAATLVGELDIAARYGRLAARVRGAFAREYVTGGGRVLSDAATIYALALEWSLLPTEEQRLRAGERLADLVRTAGFRISTGFLGTPLIADALTSTGHTDVAYRLLLQTGSPSWLYAVTMGATTVWERWDSLLDDGSINPSNMTSFNHYALGAVADWMHRTVAGLAPGAPGYRRLVVRPEPSRFLTSARASVQTPYGKAEVSWARADGLLELRVAVPVGASAVVHVPGQSEPAEVRHGTYVWHVPDLWASNGQLRTVLTVRDVLDDEKTWGAVVAAAQQLALVTGERQAAARLKGFLDAPVATLADALVPPGLVRDGDVLRARLTELLETNHRGLAPHGGGDPA
jgi:alpha-L-rhamnosidase